LWVTRFSLLTSSTRFSSAAKGHPRGAFERVAEAVAAERLASAGAHYTIESAADIVNVILDIDRRVSQGAVDI
jgi:hypothetical protein